ncbi:MAG TPA: hypothetical protein VFO49_09305 [Nocardioides sp.]|nr:hypothetical protein [Nocardioides sp.]
MALRQVSPAPAVEGLSPRRAGRLRRLYALVVILVMAGAVGWQLSHEPATESGVPAVSSAQQDTPTTHQRTVSTLVGPDAIRVVEHLSFTTPTDAVALANPEHAGVTAPFAPVIEDLSLETGGGQRLTLAAPAAGDTVRVQLPESATQVTVGYLATGVVYRTASSVPGRSLALVTPLRAGGPIGLRAAEVRGEWVDKIGCIDRDGEVAECGTGTALGWATGPEDAQLSDVVAQLTLPTD